MCNRNYSSNIFSFCIYPPWKASYIPSIYGLVAISRWNIGSHPFSEDKKLRAWALP